MAQDRITSLLQSCTEWIRIWPKHQYNCACNWSFTLSMIFWLWKSKKLAEYTEQCWTILWFVVHYRKKMPNYPSFSDLYLINHCKHTYCNGKIAIQCLSPMNWLREFIICLHRKWGSTAKLSTVISVKKCRWTFH